MRIDLISEHASPLAAIGGADSGGQNVHVAELARALGERGHHVTVYTRRDGPTLLDRVRAGPGVTVEEIRRALHESRSAGGAISVTRSRSSGLLESGARVISRGSSRAVQA